MMLAYILKHLVRPAPVPRRRYNAENQVDFSRCISRRIPVIFPWVTASLTKDSHRLGFKDSVTAGDYTILWKLK